MGLIKKIDNRTNEFRFPYEKFMIRHKCIFIHVPKTGGTSVRTALGGVDHGRHLSWDVYHQASPAKFRRYFKFAFVREPAERVFSAYIYLRNGGNQKDDLDISHYLKSFASFGDFLSTGILGKSIQYHPLFRPQASYLCDWRGQSVVDYLARYENIENEFSFLTRRIGKDKELPNINQTRYSSEGRDRLGLVDKKELYKIYKVDYEAFEYPVPGE